MSFSTLFHRSRVSSTVCWWLTPCQPPGPAVSVWLLSVWIGTFNSVGNRVACLSDYRHQVERLSSVFVQRCIHTAGHAFSILLTLLATLLAISPALKQSHAGNCCCCAFPCLPSTLTAVRVYIPYASMYLVRRFVIFTISPVILSLFALFDSSLLATFWRLNEPYVYRPL